MIRIETTLGSRVRQGDIINNVEYIYIDTEKKINKISFLYVIVLTQDCDLNQDFMYRHSDATNHDKFLLSVIVAPIYKFDDVIIGEHLSFLGYKMQTFSKKQEKLDNKNLRNNQNPRYHYIEFPQNAKLPPSIIDFKHYFTVHINYLLEHKKEHFTCKIGELYRENISHRFSYFLSRIGLPEN